MTTLTATQIAQMTATLTGGGFKRAATKEAAEARFRKIAAEKGLAPEAIDAALTTGKMPTATTVDAGPGLARLRAAPEAEAIRQAVLADEATVAAIRPAQGRKAALKLVEAAAPKEPGKRAAALEAAQRGEVPAKPDFTAATHKPFRKKLDAVAALVEAGDIAGLKAFQINPVSSSPKAIAKYRDLAVIALEARAAKVGAAA